MIKGNVFTGITELDNFDEFSGQFDKKKTTVIVSRSNYGLNNHVELDFFPKTGQFSRL